MRIDYTVKCRACGFTHQIPGAAATDGKRVRARCPADRGKTCPPGKHQPHTVLYGGENTSPNVDSEVA